MPTQEEFDRYVLKVISEMVALERCRPSYSIGGNNNRVIVSGNTWLFALDKTGTGNYKVIISDYFLDLIGLNFNISKETTILLIKNIFEKLFEISNIREIY